MSAVKTHFLRLKQLLSDFPVHRMMCVCGGGGLAAVQLTGPHPQSFCFSRPGAGPVRLHF